LLIAVVDVTLIGDNKLLLYDLNLGPPVLLRLLLLMLRDKLDSASPDSVQSCDDLTRWFN